MELYESQWILTFLLDFSMNCTFYITLICAAHSLYHAFCLHWVCVCVCVYLYYIFSFSFYHIIEWNTSNFNWLDWKQTMVVFPDILALYQFHQSFSWCPAVAVIWFCCIWLVFVVAVVPATFVMLYNPRCQYIHMHTHTCICLNAYEIYLWYIALWLSLAMVVAVLLHFLRFDFGGYKCILHSEHDWLAHATYAVCFLSLSFIAFHFILFVRLLFFFFRVDLPIVIWASNNEADIFRI